MMKIQFILFILLGMSLTGCMTWDVDSIAENAAAEAAENVATDILENAAEEAGLLPGPEGGPEGAPPGLAQGEGAPPRPEDEERVGYVPDGNDPLNGPEIKQSIQSDDPYYTPVYPNGMAPTQAPNGGIYQVGMGDAFFGDQKASKVGDILTINLNETTASTKTNAATVTKSSSATIDNPVVLGERLRVDTTLPEQGTNFAGNASANQNNSLNGTISVTVFREYPNGLLAVRGEKWLRLNQGDEYIRFSGIVRKQDISPDNTVESERVADARITYSGTGDIAAGSEQGWVSRLLNTRNMPY